MKRNLFFLFAVLLSSQLHGQQGTNENEKVARAYIEAYSDWDFEKMSTFYHDSIHFQDPTAQVAFPNGTYDHKGKAAVKGFFSGVFNNSQPEYVELIVNKMFSAGNMYVFHSSFECVLPGRWFGPDIKEKVFISIPLDTIVEIKDGKVIRHTDYGDYTNYFKQISAQTGK